MSTARSESMNATPEEVLAHPSTESEIWSIKSRLQSIATELDALNTSNASQKLDFLSERLRDAAWRIYSLKLDIEDPPTHYALDSRAFNR